MARQLFYEDTEVGSEIPTLVKHPTTRQLVKWAGVSGDYYEIHYDKDFAQRQGLSDVIVHGWLTLSFLGKMMTDWVGEQGALVKLGCSYRGIHFPCEDITCKGRVTKRYTKDSEHYVECEIWAENLKGEKTTPSVAVVILPSRA